MAVRTGYPGTEIVGDVLTKTNFDKLPGGLIAYAETSTTQSSIGGTAADLTGLTVTLTAAAGRRLRITGYVNLVAFTGSAIGTVLIREGATQLQQGATNISSGGYTNVVVSVELVPTAGSHTYKLMGVVNSGTMDAPASAALPGRITIEDLGPSF